MAEPLVPSSGAPITGAGSVHRSVAAPSSRSFVSSPPYYRPSRRPPSGAEPGGNNGLALGQSPPSQRARPASSTTVLAWGRPESEQRSRAASVPSPSEPRREGRLRSDDHTISLRASSSPSMITAQCVRRRSRGPWRGGFVLIARGSYTRGDRHAQRDDRADISDARPRPDVSRHRTRGLATDTLIRPCRLGGRACADTADGSGS